MEIDNDLSQLYVIADVPKRPKNEVIITDSPLPKYQLAHGMLCREVAVTL